MPPSYTHVNLGHVEDVAPANGLDHRWEARAARESLDAEATGAIFFRLHPGKRSPFTHRHAEAEEVYVVLRGTGRVKVGDEIRDVRPLDAIRVAAATPRAFEAGDDGLEFIAFGPHVPGDGQPVEDDWTA